MAAEALKWDGLSSMRWGKLPLQQQQNVPPRSSYSGNGPLHRNHRRPVTSTPASGPPALYTLDSDVISDYRPPTGTRTLSRDSSKFDAMARTTGWAPH